jgi:hypothetical protein
MNPYDTIFSALDAHFVNEAKATQMKSKARWSMETWKRIEMKNNKNPVMINRGQNNWTILLELS